MQGKRFEMFWFHTEIGDITGFRAELWTNPRIKVLPNWGNQDQSGHFPNVFNPLSLESSYPHTICSKPLALVLRVLLADQTCKWSTPVEPLGSVALLIYPGKKKKDKCNKRPPIYDSRLDLVGGFKHGFYFPFHIYIYSYMGLSLGCHPSHWLSLTPWFFRGVSSNHQPGI